MRRGEHQPVARARNRRCHAQRLSRVLAYIHDHLDEPLDLTTLSVLAASSVSHFHREFTASTGVPVYRLVQLLRLKRASMQLAFNPQASVTDIALGAGFANTESFSRAFKQAQGQSPSAFRRQPDWQGWQVTSPYHQPQEQHRMQVEYLDFPQTLIAALEHRGAEQLIHKTSMKFIAWRRANGIGPEQGNTYGIHYSDPANTLPEDYRFDIAVSVAQAVAANPQGVVTKVIPAGRCARVRHLGSRHYVTAADWLYREWLPQSGEQTRDYPLFFHYLNVGPELREQDMITDVYLPLR